LTERPSDFRHLISLHQQLI